MLWSDSAVTADTGPSGSFASARTNDSISCATPSTRAAAAVHTKRDASKYTALAKASTKNASTVPYHAVIRPRRLEKNGSDVVPGRTVVTGSGTERVSDAPDGLNEFVIAVDVDFIPQIADVDVDQVGFAEEIRAP